MRGEKRCPGPRGPGGRGPHRTVPFLPETPVMSSRRPGAPSFPTTSPGEKTHEVGGSGFFRTNFPRPCFDRKPEEFVYSAVPLGPRFDPNCGRGKETTGWVGAGGLTSSWLRTLRGPEVSVSRTWAPSRGTQVHCQCECFSLRTLGTTPESMVAQAFACH